MYIKRIIPYPPSFRRIAASTIDPAIGASTWAFGSHRWVANIGNFTRNPNNIISHMHSFVIVFREDQLYGILIILWLDSFINNSKIINIGNDAVTVYIIKYILAWRRSGWYPHNMIIIMVGINDASNQM